MSAKVAYLIPVAQRANQECQECDLPYEEYTTGEEPNLKHHEQSPERRAFKWFRDDYTGEKTVLYLNDLANIPADVNAIWIHVDRVNFNTAAFDAVFTSEVKENLKAFVNRGGNVFLAKQATRLEYDLVNAKHFSDDNRAELDYSDGGYIGAATWGARIQFYATNNEDDNNNHRVWGSYANHAMFKNTPHHSESYLEYVWSDSKQITDHNSGFPIAQMNMNGGDWRLELWGFQQKNNCRVLGCWENSGDNNKGCIYGGIVEFYPTASRKGTVVMLGLAAYQWINNNAGNGFDNVKKSTEDLLKYLDNKAVKGRNQDKLMTDIFNESNGWCYPTSLETENHEFRIVHPNIDGWTMSSWIPEDQRSIANIRYIERSAEDKHDRIEFYQEGTVDLHVKLTEDREFQAWPKGDYEFVRKVKFTYKNDPTPQAVADADLSSNGLDGESGKFMVLHKNMRGMNATYTPNFDGIANRAEVEIIEDGEFNRLKFTKAGTVKLNIRLNEPNYREEWAKGDHNVTKTVTFVQPAFTWTHTPDVAALNEDKNPVVVTCDNVPGAAVKYESGDPTIASVNAETGKISYIKEGTTQINAYIEINGVKFESSKENVTVNGLNITWTTAPAGTAKVGEEMTVAAAPQYGSATILYETSNCTYADGKLSFSHVGAATVRPYAVVNDHEYTGETKTINVAAPVVSWAKDGEGHDMVPEEAAVMEESSKRTPSAVCDVPSLSVKYRSADPTKISINETTGALQYLAPTEGDGIDITAYVTVGETEYSISHKTKCLKPIVEWKTAPTATAVVGQDVVYAAQVKYGDATIGYDYTNCSDVEGKLHFGHAGTATIRPYAEAYGEKYYTDETGELITITVSPDLKWVAGNPMSACVGETGKTAIATTTDGTIVYSSSDETKVSVDQSGNLTFHAYETACKVTISATVTIGETPYQISGEIDANLPNVYWVDGKQPGTTYRKDETPAAEAKLQYGPAAVQYELSNCTWANDQLTFTAEGTATVQPYVEYESKKYYGEKVTINVTASHEVYTRTVTSGKYGTICLERTSTALEGATFYWPAYKDKAEGEVDYIVLEKVDELKAGYGYFFYAESETIKVTMSLAKEALDKPIDDGEATHGMHGNFTGTKNVPDYDGITPNEYILLNNELRYGTGMTIGEHRAYLKMSEVPSPAAQVPGRRYVTMVVNNPNTTTGLENATLLNGETTKFVQNGKIYIMRGNRLYTTDGRLVK